MNDTKQFCKEENLYLNYSLIKHVCPEKHAKLHRCMRCKLIFECENVYCTAQYDVLPSIIKNGQVVEHCPLHPDWNWIREYAQARFDQADFMDRPDVEAYGRCTLRDDVGKFKWRCHKPAAHSGVCSCHNDCGKESPDKFYCCFPPDHCGKHSWEL